MKCFKECVFIFSKEVLKCLNELDENFINDKMDGIGFLVCDSFNVEKMCFFFSFLVFLNEWVLE